MSTCESIFPAGLVEHLLHRCRDGIILADEQRRVRFWNHGAEVIFGLACAEALGQDLHTLILPPEDLDRAGQTHGSFMAAGDHRVSYRRLEVQAIDRRGRRLWVELSVSAIAMDAESGCWICVMAREVSSRKQRERRLQLDASTDALSGLGNRRAFNTELSKMAGAPSSVMLADLDGFKQVNDSLGHEVGDSVICLVSTALVANFPDAICFARLGGDEFALLFGSHVADVSILRSFDELRADLVVRGKEIGLAMNVTVSAGLAKGIVDGSGPRRLLAAADAALYESKQLGKNRLVVAEAHEDASSVRVAGAGASHEGQAYPVEPGRSFRV